MMKANKIIALLLALVMMLTLFAGCGSSGSNEKDGSNGEGTTSAVAKNDNDNIVKADNTDSDTSHPLRGKIKGNTYTNEFADITFTKFNGSEFSYINVPTSDTEFDKQLKDYGTAIDMEYEYSDVSLSVSIEDLTVANSANTTETDYLEMLKDEFSQFSYKFSDIYNKNISDHTYYVIDSTVLNGSTTVFQRYYLRKKDNYMIEILMSATAENSFITMENMFS